MNRCISEFTITKNTFENPGTTGVRVFRAHNNLYDIVAFYEGDPQEHTVQEQKERFQIEIRPVKNTGMPPLHLIGQDIQACMDSPWIKESELPDTIDILETLRVCIPLIRSLIQDIIVQKTSGT